VITALANNGRNVRRFVVTANNTAVASAQQRANLRLTFQNLPGFLQQLRPALVKLGAAADANHPVLTNLNASAGQINRLFTDLVPFSHSAKPAVKSLGQASATGHQAVVAAGPTVAHLNQFAQPTPELAQNLSIVLQDLNSQSKAVEPDPRSPGGQGYSGLQALLQYGFQQTNAIDYFGQFGHILAVDGFVSMCSPYQTAATIASNLKLYGPSFRRCYQYLGPNQPGVNERDPTNPTGKIPDPGGAPPGLPGPTGSITTSLATRAPKATRRKIARAPTGAPNTTAPTSPAPPTQSGTPAAPAPSTGTGTGAGTGAGTTAAPPAHAGAPAINLGALGQLLGGVLGGKSGNTPSAGGLGGLLGNATSASGGSGAATTQQAQQLLNYLLAP
jgi:hypothetical protein